MSKAHTNGTDVLAQAIADLVVERLQENGLLKQRLLTIHEAAEYTGLTEEAIRGKVAQRKMPFVSIDRKRRFDRKDLDRWIEQNRRIED